MSIFKTVGKIQSLKPNFESYMWELENFNTIDLATGSFITSPMIPTDHPEIQWRLILFPNGRNKNNEGYLDLSVQLFSNMEITTEISAFMKFFVTNFESCAVLKQCSHGYFFKLLTKIDSYNHLLPGACNCDRLILREDIMDQKNHALVDNCLTIFSEFVSYNKVFSSLSQNEVRENNCRLKEFDDFKKLLADDKFSDFTIVAGDKQIRVHKAILATRSPVFEAMFSNEMQEKEQNTAEIVDIQYPVLKELFQYIYTGTVDDIESMTDDLLMAAEKYCVMGLKALCEKTLSKNLNVDNAIKLLSLADTHNALSLKAQAIQFIVSNPEIVDKEEFSALTPSLIVEVTRSGFQSLINK